MTFRDNVKSDMTTVFLNVDEYAETITYYLAGGGSRSILAIVDRNPPAIYDAAGSVVLPKFTVLIRNDCKLGLLSSEINTGGDEIALLSEFGDSQPERKTVMVKMNEDMGAVELACM